MFCPLLSDKEDIKQCRMDCAWYDTTTNKCATLVLAMLMYLQQK